MAGDGGRRRWPKYQCRHLSANKPWLVALSSWNVCLDGLACAGRCHNRQRPWQWQPGQSLHTVDLVHCRSTGCESEPASTVAADACLCLISTLHVVLPGCLLLVARMCYRQHSSQNILCNTSCVAVFGQLSVRKRSNFVSREFSNAAYSAHRCYMPSALSLMAVS